MLKKVPKKGENSPKFSKWAVETFWEFDDGDDGKSLINSDHRDGLLNSGDGLLNSGDGLLNSGDGLLNSGDGVLNSGDGLLW